jgi:hypothetical protein
MSDPPTPPFDLGDSLQGSPDVFHISTQQIDVSEFTTRDIETLLASDTVVLDCMLLNSLIAWNTSSEDPSLERSHMERYDFYAWIADDLLNYNEPQTKIPPVVVQPSKPITQATHRKCVLEDPENSHARCAVCMLDANSSKEWKGVRTKVFYCSSCGVCDLFTEGMTCHEIFRSDEGQQIWARNKEQGGKQPKQPYSVKTNHPKVMELRLKHGRSAKKRNRNADEDDTIVLV